MASLPSSSITEELSRIEEAAMYSAQAQFSSSKFWRSLNLALGIPATALAAIAGTAVLAHATSPRIGAAVALIAAALTAVMTTLNAAQRAEQSRVAANAYLELQGDARIFRTIDMGMDDSASARNRLDELVERRNTINQTAPIPSLVAYLLGRRNIAKGRQSYEVDERNAPLADGD